MAICSFPRRKGNFPEDLMELFTLLLSQTTYLQVLKWLLFIANSHCIFQTFLHKFLIED